MSGVEVYLVSRRLGGKLLLSSWSKRPTGRRVGRQGRGVGGSNHGGRGRATNFRRLAQRSNTQSVAQVDPQRHAVGPTRPWGLSPASRARRLPPVAPRREVVCTHHMSIGALVFDLDGVIVKTNFVKHAAMLSLFDDFPEQRGAISEFILSNGGVPRRAKLAHLLRSTFGAEPTDALLSEYLRRYAKSLEQQLAVAPMVEGVREFIAGHEVARYVCSSAPEAEVHGQIGRRSLAPHFSAVYGGSVPKANALRFIAARHAGQAVVFFGDSVGDHEAACEAAVAFVGVVCERDNFQHMPVVKLHDFTDRAAVEQSMHEALARMRPKPSLNMGEPRE